MTSPAGVQVSEIVAIEGGPATARIRNPVLVALFSLITLYVYTAFWWYFINREMRDLGYARRVRELGDNPVLSVVAVTLGWLVIVPGAVSCYGTCKRIQVAQHLVGRRDRLNGWLALLAFLVTPVFAAYLQVELNKVWETLRAPNGQMRLIPPTDAQTTSAELPLPAWYPDPTGQARLRYWDGRRWTEHTAE